MYRFFVRSSLGQYQESWQIETQRLKVKGKRFVSMHNRVITGLLMTLTYYCIWYVAAGLLGVFLYSIVILIAKFVFEAVNYIEHYGVVRVPGTKILPRHSWDCDSRMSSNALMNLSRHADHHANAQKKYWELESQNTGLQLHYGYIGMIVVAMLPFWWHRFAVGQLKNWDLFSASPEERVLAEKANLESGHSLFFHAVIKES